jgi:hypothetical protein
VSQGVGPEFKPQKKKKKKWASHVKNVNTKVNRKAELIFLFFI